MSIIRLYSFLLLLVTAYSWCMTGLEQLNADAVSRLCVFLTPVDIVSLSRSSTSMAKLTKDARDVLCSCFTTINLLRQWDKPLMSQIFGTIYRLPRAWQQSALRELDRATTPMTAADY